MNKIVFCLAKLQRKINLPAIRYSNIDKKASIASGCDINYLNIGKYSYIGKKTYVYKATVGSFCSIADYCHIGAPSHNISYVSTSPVFCKGRNTLNVHFSFLNEEEEEEVIIGNDVWIGANVKIKSGVTISDGAIIGMGSVVTKDVPAYEIWAGNPAKKIRARFPEEIKEALLKVKWWEFDETKLQRNAHLFSSPSEFIKQYKNEEI